MDLDHQGLSRGALHYKYWSLGGGNCPSATQIHTEECLISTLGTDLGLFDKNFGTGTDLELNGL